METIFSGPAFRVVGMGSGIFELVFDLAGESANKFNEVAIRELAKAVSAIESTPNVRGVMITSGKDGFIVGADVTEFTRLFSRPQAEIAQWISETNALFSRIEDMTVPTIAAISGFALGGGMELALTCSFRIATADAKVGLPETKLGIIPGWGGTVRLPRLIGFDNAVEWIAGGGMWSAEEALKVGAIDGVAEKGRLRDVARAMLEDAASGKLDWQARRKKKMECLTLTRMDLEMATQVAKGFVAGNAGPNYPAPVMAVETMATAATMNRAEALEQETKAFAHLAHTPQAKALVAVFLGEQAVKKAGKDISRGARPVRSAAVLGAGIMGGGIAYQAASQGISIVMKDIREDALTLGTNEAAKLLDGQISRRKLTTRQAIETMARIRPTLHYAELAERDCVIEAVVENIKVKQAVLREVEGVVSDTTILASNTSTINISQLAEGLRRPERFCGMHFFNPVHRMPLVEVIRGQKTSAECVATAVAVCRAIGKTPIVVNDCPGFLVNRVLFPYFAGFLYMVRDGIDFQAIDAAMEAFGWPMGPAYLLDVVGIDTAQHAATVMAQGFPERMSYDFKNAIDVMVENRRFGQKTKNGFYQYEEDKKGKPKKKVDPESVRLLYGGKRPESLPPEVIVSRMMLPMILEATRCLEENIVTAPVDVDMGVIYGLGFPPFRGGLLRYCDSVGAAEMANTGEQLKAISPMYAPTKLLQNHAAKRSTFYT